MVGKFDEMEEAKRGRDEQSGLTIEKSGPSYIF
jgi:hypothetical protein